MQGQWHILRDGDALTLARALPVRFDVRAVTRTPHVARARLAHQVRQDLWRKLQSVRGFSPVVRVTHSDVGALLEAGGRLACAAPTAYLLDQIAAMLADTDLRSRWFRNAQRSVV